MDSGHCRRITAKSAEANFPVSAIWSNRWNCLFIGAAYAGHLFRYTPGSDKIEDLGAINKDHQAANFPCQLDEDLDGNIYIGSFGGADLTRYNPATDKFTNFGRMDDTDMYLYPRCGKDGTVAGLVKMTKPHVVVFDPETKEKKSVGPIADTDSGHGHVNLIKGCDGLLYIKSHEGCFRLEHFQAVSVDEIPEPMPAPSFSDGTTAEFLDAKEYSFKRIGLTGPDGKTTELQLDWESDGTTVFMTHTGPDGCIYGSSILPEHFFKYDPGTGECIDFGQCSPSGGEAYSMGNFAGKIYIASYPGANLSVYDPSQDYQFGEAPGSNPRHLGRMDKVAYRPFAMCAGPSNKIWVASIPDYGMWGGTLAWYDPATNSFGSHRHIIKNCAPISLTWMEDDNLLLAGFTTGGGSGTIPKAERAGLVLWDTEKDQENWQGTLGLDIVAVISLKSIGNGLVYATIQEDGDQRRPRLHLLDLRNKSVIASAELTDEPFGYPLYGPGFFVHGNYLYGASTRGVYRTMLGQIKLEMYWHTTPENACIGAGGTLAGNKWYFATRHQLRSLKLPEATGRD